MLYSGKMKGRQGDMLLKGFIRTLRGKMFLVIILIGIPAISLIIWNTADLQKKPEDTKNYGNPQRSGYLYNHS